MKTGGCFCLRNSVLCCFLATFLYSAGFMENWGVGNRWIPVPATPTAVALAVDAALLSIFAFAAQRDGAELV
jgi:hypothetical protein